MTVPFTGVGVALVTLFDASGELDASATAEHAGRLVEDGASAVIVGGSTGEASALSPDERTALLEAVRGTVGGRVPLIAGTGAPSARQAVDLTQRAITSGADALLVLSPPHADDPRMYYADVARAAQETPLLAYHFPAMSSPGIPVQLVDELPVAGLKDSSGDARRLLIEQDLLAEGLYVGDPALLSLAGSIGCSGAIMALANVDLDGCRRAWSGDTRAQLGLISGHRQDALTGIRGLKHVLNEQHGTSPVTRLG